MGIWDYRYIFFSFFLDIFFNWYKNQKWPEKYKEIKTNIKIGLFSPFRLPVILSKGGYVTDFVSIFAEIFYGHLHIYTSKYILIWHLTAQIVLHFTFFFKFIYLFLAALGLCCHVRAFSSCSERGLLLVMVRGLLIAVASLVVKHAWALGGQASVVAACGLSSCGTRA